MKLTSSPDISRLHMRRVALAVLVGCLLSLFPLIGSAIAVAFFLGVFIQERKQTIALCIGAMIVGVTAFEVIQQDMAFYLVGVAAISAIVMAYLISTGRFLSGVVTAFMLITAVMLGILDIVLGNTTGISLYALVSELLNQVEAQLAQAADISSITALTSLKAALELYWPSLYVVYAAFMTLVEYLGARVVLKRAKLLIEAHVSLQVDRSEKRAEELTLPVPPETKNYHAPLWALSVGLAGLIALVAAPLVDPSLSGLVNQGGINAVQIGRLVLALQGFGVLRWLVAQHTQKIPGVLIGLAAIVLIGLEVQYFTLTAVGLFDLWANVRTKHQA